MELKNLFDDQADQLSDLNYDYNTVHKQISHKGSNELSYILWYYRTALGLNLMFLAIFFLVYLSSGKIELVLPLLLIALSYAIIIRDITTYLSERKMISPDQPLIYYIEKQLHLLLKAEESHKKRIPIIILLSFIGGFIGGLIYSGWTYQKMLDKPVVLLILLIFSGILYPLIQRSSYQGLNSLFAKKYNSKKKRLQQLLSELKEDGISATY